MSRAPSSDTPPYWRARPRHSWFVALLLAHWIGSLVVLGSADVTVRVPCTSITSTYTLSAKAWVPQPSDANATALLEIVGCTLPSASILTILFDRMAPTLVRFQGVNTASSSTVLALSKLLCQWDPAVVSSASYLTWASNFSLSPFWFSIEVLDCNLANYSQLFYSNIQVTGGHPVNRFALSVVNSSLAATEAVGAIVQPNSVEGITYSVKNSTLLANVTAAVAEALVLVVRAQFSVVGVAITVNSSNISAQAMGTTPSAAIEVLAGGTSVNAATLRNVNLTVINSNVTSFSARKTATSLYLRGGLLNDTLLQADASILTVQGFDYCHCVSVLSWGEAQRLSIVLGGGTAVSAVTTAGTTDVAYFQSYTSKGSALSMWISDATVLAVGTLSTGFTRALYVYATQQFGTSIVVERSRITVNGEETGGSGSAVCVGPGSASSVLVGGTLSVEDSTLEVTAAMSEILVLTIPSTSFSALVRNSSLNSNSNGTGAGKYSHIGVVKAVYAIANVSLSFVGCAVNGSAVVGEVRVMSVVTAAPVENLSFTAIDSAVTATASVDAMILVAGTSGGGASFKNIALVALQSEIRAAGGTNVGIASFFSISTAIQVNGAQIVAVNSTLIASNTSKPAGSYVLVMAALAGLDVIAWNLTLEARNTTLQARDFSLSIKRTSGAPTDVTGTTFVSCASTILTAPTLGEAVGVFPPRCSTSNITLVVLLSHIEAFRCANIYSTAGQGSSIRFSELNCLNLGSFAGGCSPKPNMLFLTNVTADWSSSPLKDSFTGCVNDTQEIFGPWRVPPPSTAPIDSFIGATPSGSPGWVTPAYTTGSGTTIRSASQVCPSFVDISSFETLRLKRRPMSSSPACQLEGSPTACALRSGCLWDEPRQGCMPRLCHHLTQDTSSGGCMDSNWCTQSGAGLPCVRKTCSSYPPDPISSCNYLNGCVVVNSTTASSSSPVPICVELICSGNQPLACSLSCEWIASRQLCRRSRTMTMSHSQTNYTHSIPLPNRSSHINSNTNSPGATSAPRVTTTASPPSTPLPPGATFAPTSASPPTTWIDAGNATNSPDSPLTASPLVPSGNSTNGTNSRRGNRTASVTQEPVLRGRGRSSDLSATTDAISRVVGSDSVAHVIVSVGTVASVASGVVTTTMAMHSRRVESVSQVVGCLFSDDDTEPSKFEQPIRVPIGTSDFALYVGSTALSYVVFVMVPLMFLVALWATGRAEGGTAGGVKVRLVQKKVTATLFYMSFGYFGPTSMKSFMLVVLHSNDVIDLVTIVAPLLTTLLLFVWLGRIVISRLPFEVVVEGGPKLVEPSTELGAVLLLDASGNPPGSSSTSNQSDVGAAHGDGAGGSGGGKGDHTSGELHDAEEEEDEELKWTNRNPYSMFTETFGPTFDAARLAALPVRAFWLEEFLITFLLQLVEGIRPNSGSCGPLALVMLLVTLAHTVFLVAVRPYAETPELILCIIGSVLLVLLALLATLLTFSTPTAALESAFGIVGLLEMIHFFIQAAVLAFLALAEAHRKRLRRHWTASESVEVGEGEGRRRVLASKPHSGGAAAGAANEDLPMETGSNSTLRVPIAETSDSSGSSMSNPLMGSPRMQR
jgi:hypothetical protein